MKPSYCSDFATFLAYSMALEQESAERLAELANAMVVHNNQESSTLLNWLAEMSEDHVHEVEAIASAHQLPPLKPWEFHWDGAEAPETAPYDRFHYLTTPVQILTEVYEMERAAETFYRRVAEHSEDTLLAECALGFAEEEKQHAEAVKQALSRQSLIEAVDQQLDWDPPVMPE